MGIKCTYTASSITLTYTGAALHLHTLQQHYTYMHCSSITLTYTAEALHLHALQATALHSYTLKAAALHLHRLQAAALHLVQYIIHSSSITLIYTESSSITFAYTASSSITPTYTARSSITLTYLQPYSYIPTAALNLHRFQHWQHSHCSILTWARVLCLICMQEARGLQARGLRAYISGKTRVPML